MEPPFLKRIQLSSPLQEDSYLSALPAVQSLFAAPLSFHGPVTFFAGENGSGKSTLLEAVAVASGFNPEGGTRNFSFSTKETHSELYRALTLVRTPHRPRDGFFLRAESFYNVASEVDRLDREGPSLLIDSYGGRSLHEQSHGESFFALILNRFSGQGLYLLDEPEAALSAARQLALLARIHELVELGSQFLIATHSPILLGYPDAEIFELSEHGIAPIPYEHTEAYILTRRFLLDREHLLSGLFSD